MPQIIQRDGLSGFTDLVSLTMGLSNMPTTWPVVSLINKWLNSQSGKMAAREFEYVHC